MPLKRRGRYGGERDKLANGGSKKGFWKVRERETFLKSLAKYFEIDYEVGNDGICPPSHLPDEYGTRPF